MNYYKRHIGDYSAKAGHLSPLEHGVYSLLIDSYYNRERAPTRAEAIRLARARSEDELAAVDVVLEEFFTEDAGVYRQSRIDEEIAAYQANASTNQRIAADRESTKRARTVDEACSKREPNHKPLTTNHKPITKEQEQKPPIVPKGDGGASERAVIESYHRILPACQRFAVLSPKRKARIAKVVRLARKISDDQGWTYVPDEFWNDYFLECAKDPWLRGEVANPNNSRWIQNLDVLLAEDRFCRIMDEAISPQRIPL